MGELWRVPVAFLVRAPLLIIGYSLEWLSAQIVALGVSIPGLPNHWRRKK